MTKASKLEDLAWLTPEVAERFNLKVLRTDDPDDCWLWNGTKFAKGHGYLNVGGTNRSVLRIAYALSHPDTPLVVGLHVVHRHGRCPPLCVRPDHLVQAAAGSRSTALLNLEKRKAPPVREDDRRRIIEIAEKAVIHCAQLGLTWQEYRRKIDFAAHVEAGMKNLDI